MTRTAAQEYPDTVTVTETGIGKFQVEVLAAGSTFLADEPVEVGGLGSGPNPYDLLGSALGACTVMTLRLYAGRKGWPLERATVRVLHSRTAGGKDRFAREVTLEGPLDEDQRRRMMEIADRCPVHRTLEGSSEIITVMASPPDLAALERSGLGHMQAMEEACLD